MVNRNEAETIALQALGYLVADETLRGRFMSVSGVAREEFEANAEDPAFLAGVLDFFLAHESDLLALCDAAELSPELPAAARRCLAGEFLST